nr:oligopeptide/dipeptide ABC transporter ATP-binding protein [uncultured Duganella sp.]
MSSLPEFHPVSPEQPILKTERLSKAFNVSKGWPRKPQLLQAVHAVDLELFKGKTLGIVGESGCGKSTLSRMLVGILKPSGGSILIGGTDVSTLPPAQWRETMRDVQMVFQSPYSSLNPRMTVGDIVREPLDIHDKQLGLGERRERTLQILERVGMNASFLHKSPHELSGGQQQRIGIARALVRRTPIVVCDEPVSALDVSVQAQVVNLMLDLQAELGLTYVFVSHDLAVVANVAHDINVMYMGRVVEAGTAVDVLQSPRHPYTQALVASANVPDPLVERARNPRVLVGELPDPANPPSGCPFRTRCWMACAECAASVPALTNRSGSPQRVACHFA